MLVWVTEQVQLSNCFKVLLVSHLNCVIYFWLSGTLINSFEQINWLKEFTTSSHKMSVQQCGLWPLLSVRILRLFVLGHLD